MPSTRRSSSSSTAVTRTVGSFVGAGRISSPSARNIWNGVLSSLCARVSPAGSPNIRHFQPGHRAASSPRSSRANRRAPMSAATSSPRMNHRSNTRCPKTAAGVSPKSTPTKIACPSIAASPARATCASSRNCGHTGLPATSEPGLFSTFTRIQDRDFPASRFG